MNIEKTAVDWYAHGARYYDPQLARWHSPDPLSELYSSSSPYHYVANNPVNYIDPNGMSQMSSQVHNQLDIENGRGNYNWEMAYKLGGGGRLSPDPNSWNNVGRFMSDPGPGVPYTDENGNTYETGQDPVTGEMYYTVEYVKDWYNKSTLEYMYTTPDGSKRVPYASNNGDAKALTFAGLTLLTDWGQEGTQVFQGSNEAVRAAAIRNGIPTDAIDDIIRKTSNFKSVAKYAGRGFIAAGVVVSVIDGAAAYKAKDYAGVTMAGMDLLVGLGTAAVGGPIGILLYGGYILVMHAPVVPNPAFMSDPTSQWNRLPRIDNTYVAPNYY